MVTEKYVLFLFFEWIEGKLDISVQLSCGSGMNNEYIRTPEVVTHVMAFKKVDDVLQSKTLTPVSDFSLIAKGCNLPYLVLTPKRSGLAGTLAFRNCLLECRTLHQELVFWTTGL